MNIFPNFRFRTCNNYFMSEKYHKMKQGFNRKEYFNFKSA